MPKELLSDTFINGVCPTLVKSIISNLFIKSHNLMGLYIYLIMKNKYVNAYNLEWAKDKINARWINARIGRGRILYQNGT